jgi:prolipoprotein diacylglyceryltransferase
MLLLEGASRYIMEMIRVEPAVLGKQSFSMVLSAALFAAGIIMWWACGQFKPHAGRRIATVPAA